MRKRWMLPLLVLALLLCGCGGTGPEEVDLAEQEMTAQTEISPTVPADGDPNDVTCKGSYTGAATSDVVAVSGGHQLTGDQLQVWYWAEIARYRQENHDTAPDFDRPLDTQICEIDSSVNSWQQYFLKRALSSWQQTQTLVRHSEEVPLATEEAYQPNPKRIQQYMTNMPASEFLYGYATHYRPNSMHQAYLDQIPQMLDELARKKGYVNANEMAKKAFGTSVKALRETAELYNRGYMYFTHLSYDIEPEITVTETDLSVSPENISVDFRQILLIPKDILQEDTRPKWQQKRKPLEPVVLEKTEVAPDGTVTCSEKAWTICEGEAQEMLTYWRKKTAGTEATFGEAAHQHTVDPGTKVNGGLYQGIRKDQMLPQIDSWCFDPARQPGDTAVLRSDYGVHILYFCGSRTLETEAAEADSCRQQQLALIDEARQAFPVEINYSRISLEEAQGTVSPDALLYPDVAHERFPEIPLYLQQDYPSTMYGGFTIVHNGCGITSFAMLSSYMADDELTPPEMCDRFGRYSHSNGTDGTLFNKEPSGLGYYLREKTYEPRIAKKALEDGHVVISVQHPGYWTTAGHYIVCESINEEGLVQVRDSNIFNYARVRSHAEDLHKWGNIVGAGSGYWIFEHKITRIPACSRCGAPEGVTEQLLNWDYLCGKCDMALLRRNTYLNP